MKDNKREWYNALLCLCVTLLTLTFITVTILFSISLFSKETSLKITDSSAQILGLVISLTAVCVTFSIAIPVFISRRQINDTVSEFLNKEYRENIEYKVDEISTVDSHLARMTAFLLAEHKYYYWAIGWGFHALKSYQPLKGDRQHLYVEFHELVIRNIILRSVKNMINDESLREGSGISNSDLLRIKLRALKDFIDFEYDIHERDRNSPYASGIKTNLKKELAEIENGMKEIFSGLIENYSFEFDSMDIQKRQAALKKTVLEISKYRGSKKDLKRLSEFFETKFF